MLDLDVFGRAVYFNVPHARVGGAAGVARHPCRRRPFVTSVCLAEPACNQEAVDAMGFSGEHVQLVATVGNAAILWRRLQGSVSRPALGAASKIPPARPQRSIPPLKMPTARGWAPRRTPVEAPGLQVNALTPGLRHPSWVHALPDGDVPVAGALFPPGPVKALFGDAMVSTMGRGGRLRQSEPHYVVV
ncbi:hypothetical protein [Variovorax sp. GT1P44]|uniref:hypothetical protein n=1 Tax=Variovorax sp. GT1P44 TaxID=3443742 RepID=UPI003F48A141